RRCNAPCLRARRGRTESLLDVGRLRGERTAGTGRIAVPIHWSSYRGQRLEEAQAVSMRTPHAPPPFPWESAIGNGESGRKTSPHRTPPPFFHRRLPRSIIPHSHDSPFPIADSPGRGEGEWEIADSPFLMKLGWGGVGRIASPIPHSHDSPFPIAHSQGLVDRSGIPAPLTASPHETPPPRPSPRPRDFPGFLPLAGCRTAHYSPCPRPRSGGERRGESAALGYGGAHSRRHPHASRRSDRAAAARRGHQQRNHEPRWRARRGQGVRG